jgi:cytochrome P450
VIRRSVEEDNLNGYYIPAQSIMMCHIFGLHRNPEYWSDPNTFDPYRFAPDNIHKQVPNSFLPFSTGLRLCIASQFAVVEMQMILIRLLQHFRISALPGQRIEMDPLVTLKTRTPVHLCVERR